MKIVDITMEHSEIVLFPENVLIEIIQNIKTILTTLQGTVPLDRDFGIDGTLIDKPLTVAKPLIVKDIKEKIEQYEPRAKFVSISWSGNDIDGKLIPSIKVAIK
ncbi:MAG: hypothetical protein SO022_02860 [Selenomonadaceae bacterium]|nr:hypothetical protein [Selenomonadaceae bacterium]